MAYTFLKTKKRFCTLKVLCTFSAWWFPCQTSISIIISIIIKAPIERLLAPTLKCYVRYSHVSALLGTQSKKQQRWLATPPKWTDILALKVRWFHWDQMSETIQGLQLLGWILHAKGPKQRTAREKLVNGARRCLVQGKQPGQWVSRDLLGRCSYLAIASGMSPHSEAGGNLQSADPNNAFAVTEKKTSSAKDKGL